MELIEKAPAKINLGLDVLSKRPDGYHELEMIMTSIDLADRLTFQPLPTKEIEIVTNCSFLPLDKKNNIYQTVQLLQQNYGVNEGVRIHLQKEIPVAAGLGGGSSDAAATLRGLNRLWQLNLPMTELEQLGDAIGTDVPYCVQGKTSRVTGRGEIVTTLPPVPQCWVVVAKPKVSVSTSKIFKLVSVEDLYHPNISAIETAILEQNYFEMVTHLGNSLEPVTAKRYPQVHLLKEKFMQFGADGAVMSGSGPTVFGLCHKYSRAKRVYNGLKGFCDHVSIVRTL